MVPYMSTTPLQTIVYLVLKLAALVSAVQAANERAMDDHDLAIGFVQTGFDQGLRSYRC